MTVDTLWYTHCPLPTASSIARHLGWLDDEFSGDAIEIRTLGRSADRAVRDSHFTHTQPSSFRHGGNLPPIFARSIGSDVRLLGMTWVDVGNAILAMPDAGIASAADLRGRRLSVPRRPNAAFDFWRAHVLRTYEAALTSAGLSSEDVEFVDVVVAEDEAAAPPAASVSLLDTSARLMRRHREEAIALVRGDVDVIATEGQTAVTIQPTLGLVTVVDLIDFEVTLERVNNTCPTLLTVSGALLDDRPDIVHRWLARVLVAAEWARSHEAEAKRIAALECGLHEDHVDRAFSPALHRQLGVVLDAESLLALRQQHDLLLRHGFIAGPVDLEAFIAREPLAAASSVADELMTSPSYFEVTP